MLPSAPKREKIIHMMKWSHNLTKNCNTGVCDTMCHEIAYTSLSSSVRESVVSLHCECVTDGKSVKKTGLSHSLLAMLLLNAYYPIAQKWAQYHKGSNLQIRSLSCLCFSVIWQHSKVATIKNAIKWTTCWMVSPVAIGYLTFWHAISFSSFHAVRRVYSTEYTKTRQHHPYFYTIAHK